MGLSVHAYGDGEGDNPLLQPTDRCDVRAQVCLHYACVQRRLHNVLHTALLILVHALTHSCAVSNRAGLRLWTGHSVS